MSESTENALKLPHRKVLDALFRKFAENKEKVASINGELGERIKAQRDNNEAFTAFFWSIYSKVRHKNLSNELKAREMILIGRAALDLAEAEIDGEGHVGDLADMAKQPEQPKNAMPLDEAEKAFEANAHKAPTPAEVDAGAKKKRGLRSIKGGKEDVKAVADKHVAAQEERLGATDAAPLDDGFDDLEPPKAPEKAKNPLEGATGTGTYSIN